MANSVEVKVPDIGNFEGVPVIEILVKPGDAVAKDQGLVTLESDKATMEVPSSVAGVVKEVRMRPPHAWIMLEVKGDNGELQLWPLEAASPTALQGIGVTPDYVKAGDTIKARCRRLRVVPQGHDNDCILGFLKAKDGTVKDWSGTNAAVPADF